MKTHLMVFLCLICGTPLYCQIYNDFLGNGHDAGIRVETSSDAGDKKGANTLFFVGSSLLSPEEEASRFLGQATFGPTPEEIDFVVKNGYGAWFENQVNLPPTYTTDIMEDMKSFYPWPYYPPYPLPRHFQTAWWHVSLTAPDQLRQRVAFALSQIFVVSFQIPRETGYGLSDYYDMLADHAFGNFRDLLEGVALHPKMGWYLSHLNNPKENPEMGTSPDENFARELMQLFSIGLYELNPNGTRKLNAQGGFIPTYDNEDIQEMAKVFTGLGGADVRKPGAQVSFGLTEAEFGTPYRLRIDPTVPMKMYEEYHDQTEKRLLNGLVIPAGQKGMDDINDALDFLFEHPNTGPFIARRLIQRLIKSNPSPEYIERVSRVFNDNGAGVRGDMKAVIQAILFDPEARVCNFLLDPKNGRLKEPIIRYTQLLRGFKVRNNAGWLANLGIKFYEEVKQNILSSPSVFNFYTPDFIPSGELTRAELFAPEFQIFNTNTSIRYINLAYEWTIEEEPLTFSLTSSPAGKVTSSLTLDPYLDLVVNDPDELVNRLDLILCHGQMSDHTRKVIRNAVLELRESEGTGGAARRSIVNHALFLTLISPDYAVMR